MRPLQAYPGGFAFRLTPALITLLSNAVLGFVAFIKDNSPIKLLTAQPIRYLAQA